MLTYHVSHKHGGEPKGRTFSIVANKKVALSALGDKSRAFWNKKRSEK